MRLGDGDRLLSLHEAANLTGRKLSTWRKDVYLRRVAIVRIGRQVKIPLSEVQRLINQGYRPAILCLALISLVAFLAVVVTA